MRRGSEVMTSNRMNVVFAVMMNSSGNGTMLIWNGIPIVPVERRERVIAIGIGSTGNGRNPTINGRRQPSCGDTSRMNREVHVRLCVQERLACSAGDKPAGAKVRRPVVRIAGWRETKTLKPIDEVSFRGDYESPGRNESKRRSGLESD